LYGEERVELAVLDHMDVRQPAMPLEASAKDVVFLQLTSGSTGTPKAIQITHRGILAHANAAGGVNHFTECDTSLNWLAMDHVAPVLTYHFKDVIVGSRQVHVDMDWILGDPLRWLDLIDEFRVTHSWSPNFGYKLLTEAHARRGAREKATWDLTCLQQLMNAGEQVTMAVIRPFCDAFRAFGLRDAVMQPAFGMAESCTAITYNNDFTLDGSSEVCGSVGGIGKPLRLEGRATASFVDCGAPLPGVELRIADADNRALCDDVCGRVQLRGAVITPGYLDNPEANAEAFVGDGWFNTGDLGFARGGRLFLVGREKETIIIRGANFFCYELEEHVSRRVGVLDTFVAATSVADADAGTEQLLLFFVPDDNYLPGVTESDVAQSVSAAFGVIPHAVIAVARADFAKTTSGKIQRTQMRARYLAEELMPRLGHEPLAERVFVPIGVSTPNLSVLQTRHAVWLGSETSTLTRLPFGKLTRVERGAGFARNEHGFTLDPTSEADYSRLFEALAETHAPVTLLFAWDFGAEASWLDAVVPLVRALVAAHGGGRLALDELVVVGEHFLRSGGESSGNVHAEIAAGYLKAACQELAGVRYRVIDFSGYPHARRHSALLAELCEPLGHAEQSGREVACRESGLLVARTLESRVDNGVLFQPLAFELEPGTIAISGGIGGLGKRLAQDLLRHVPAARIALFGRSAHTLQRQDWPALSQANFERLEYHQADFSDAPAVLHALGETPVSALFHLAGVPRYCLARDESLHEVAAVVRPKAGAEGT
jgi:acyl-CoA synthetase (AMP-forming)/AMP-acid ligase II